MNIDKDIELVSNMKNIELRGKVNEHYIYAKIPVEYLNAVENVLADRETWKKIAYKLAEELDGNGDYVQNIIEWARKEVDK